jgi:hypothetical protein
MALPLSGTISMDMIRAELGVPSQSPFSLDTARSGGYVALNTNSPSLPPSSGQVSLASWYGYCQNCDTYSFSYATTQGVACINNDPITIISSTIPIGVGSILNLADGSQAFYPYYYSDGTNWYFADGDGLEQTIVQSTGSCAPASYTINWTNNNITTGTNQLEIYKNGNLMVNQGGLGSGSFSIIATDIITYNLASTTPNFTYALISVNTSGPGTVSDCNFNSAYASETGGLTFNSNTTIDGITIDYIDACP